MTASRAACFAGVVKEKRVSDELLNEPIEKSGRAELETVSVTWCAFAKRVKMDQWAAE